MSPKKNNHIIKQLTQGEAVSLYDYMGYCLTDEVCGYYRGKAAIGRGGDFTTAPEISQIFGETIGFWLADLWQRCGEPKQFTVIECGGGRGVLMRDVLHLLKNHNIFTALKIIMVDINPHFRMLQKELLAEFADKITWCEDLAEVSPEGCMAVIGNEFLDVLPIRQFEYKNHSWCEKYVIKNGNKLQYHFKATKFLQKLDNFPQETGETWQDKDIYEYAPDLPQVMRNIAALARNGGALLVDYGYEKREFRDSLQAVKKQKYADVLIDFGDLQKPDEIPDLSAHVDFGAAAREAQTAGLMPLPLMSQREFLSSMGGALRLQKLLPSAKDEASRERLVSGYERISDPQGMGGLFKVLMLYGENSAHAN